MDEQSVLATVNERGLPTRNGGQFLRNCIESVLTQDYDDFELIISDNANSDDTPAIINQYAGHDRVRAIRLDEAVPVTDNWNAAYRLRNVGGAALGAPGEIALYPARAGTRATLRILFTAPFAEGVYESAWQAMDANGSPFGDPIYIRVAVQ